MAVVDIYTTAFPNPATKPEPVIPSDVKAGDLKRLSAPAVLTNGNSSTSVVHFGKVPSNGRPSRALSKLHYDAITSLTDFDVGFPVKTINGLTNSGSTDNLLDGKDISSAGSTELTGIDLPDDEKTFWQLAGYSNDPGGDLEVQGTLNAGAGATGDLLLTLVYSVP